MSWTRESATHRETRTAERYRAEIRAFCGFREATSADAEELATWLRDHAVSGSRDREYLTASLEVECRRRSLEPPVPDRVERIVRAAVHGYEERFCAQVHAQLSPLTRSRLDALLNAADLNDVDDEATSTRAAINTLRDDAGRVGVNSMRDEIVKIIRNLELPAGLFAHARPQELDLLPAAARGFLAGLSGALRVWVEPPIAPPRILRQRNADRRTLTEL